MNKKVLSLFLAVLMLVSFTLVACSNEGEDVSTDQPPAGEQTDDGDKSSETPAAGEKVYRFAASGDVESMNPHNQEAYAVGDITIYTDSLLYRKFPTEDGESFEIAGDIAVGDPYLADEDGYVWRVDLREDAVWQNGEPINADTFIYSFKMLLDPDLVNPIASFMYDSYIDIVNAKEYFMQNQDGAEKVDWEDVGIKKIDDYTLEFTTEQRWTAEHVKMHLIQRSMHPVYEEYYEAGMNSSRTTTTYGTDLDNYMGSGPYIFKEWNRDASRTYVKNEDHWLADYYNHDRIEVRIAPDSNARVQLFESGDIDVLGVSGTLIERYEDDPRLYKYLGIGARHLEINTLNTDKPILGTLNFRKAMFYAMDRETICDVVGYLPSGYYINHEAAGIPEKGLSYRETPEAKAVEPENYGYDPDLAKEYFEAALEEVNETFVSIEYVLSDGHESSKLIGELLQDSLPKIFGEDKFELTMRFVPSGSLSAMTDWKNDPTSYDMYTTNWNASNSRVFPYTALQYFRSDYSARPNTYVAERFDELYAELSKEETRLDPQLMVELTAELEKVYLDEVMGIPVGQIYNYVLYSDRVKLPVNRYVPDFGFGAMFGEIVE